MYRLKPTIRIKVLFIALSVFLFSIQCMARKKKQDRYTIESETHNILYLKESRLFDQIDSLLTECKKRCPDCYWHYDYFWIFWFYAIEEGIDNESHSEYTKYNGKYYGVESNICESDLNNTIRCDSVSKPIIVNVIMSGIPYPPWIIYYKNYKYYIPNQKEDYNDFFKKHFKYSKKNISCKHSKNSFGPPKIPKLEIFYNTDGTVDVIKNDCTINELFF